ncbi:hypothetical protein D1646_03885 [Pseudoflavonifractor sp. 60]|uniref:hypothetical protein n=1 Tax=Pseudoflavonifractor sp. 60 TaxID=2304576 RepID=UPI00136FD5FE|nr:hypothetical protein [Pseudoflavonifractor sp. 60]NBI65963.1 hypothetical protein [Pseudoflavonifractor sp. 60]
MNLSCYTIDDLRLGYDPQGESGWRQSHFLDWRDALEQYLSLPDSAVKALGVSSGGQEVELMRRLSICGIQENVLVLDFLAIPLWAEDAHVLQLARDLVSELDIRYCLAVDRLVPILTGNIPSKRLEGKYLWPNIPGDLPTAICWLCMPGTGWVSPKELKRRFPAPEKTFQYPLVTRYRVDGVTPDGNYVPLELTYWEYKMLEQRTQLRLDHKKIEGGQ